MLKCLALALAATATNAVQHTQSFAFGGDSTEDYKLLWEVTGDEISITMEAPTTGWIGFGISESTSGSMPGSDMYICSVDGNQTTLEDRHAIAKATPHLDCVQDATLVSAAEENGVTTCTFTRKLVSDDAAQDREIYVDDRQNAIVFAIGSSDNFGFHAKRGLSFLHFDGQVRNVTGDLLVIPNIHTVDFRASDFEFPTLETTYKHFNFNVSSFVPVGSTEAFINGFTAEVNAESIAYVHHFIVTAYRCLDEECLGEQIYAWARGTQPMRFPHPIKLSTNCTDAPCYIDVQIHYDNPNGVAGHRDSSGVRAYFTTTHTGSQEMGMVQLGDPQVQQGRNIPAQGNHPADAFSLFTYECTSDCTRQKLSGATQAWAVILHGHDVLRSITLNHWRPSAGGRFTEDTLVNTVSTEYWSVSNQVVIPLNWTMQPGDRLTTSCTQKLSATEVEFGLDSDQEMCMAFLYFIKPSGSTFAMCGYLEAGGIIVNTCDDKVFLSTDSYPVKPLPESAWRRTWPLEPPVGTQCVAGYAPLPVERDPVTVFGDGLCAGQNGADDTCAACSGDQCSCDDCGWGEDYPFGDIRASLRDCPAWAAYLQDAECLSPSGCGRLPNSTEGINMCSQAATAPCAADPTGGRPIRSDCYGAYTGTSPLTELAYYTSNDCSGVRDGARVFVAADNCLDLGGGSILFDGCSWYSYARKGCCGTPAASTEADIMAHMGGEAMKNVSNGACLPTTQASVLVNCAGTAPAPAPRECSVGPEPDTAPTPTPTPTPTPSDGKVLTPTLLLVFFVALFL